MSLRGALVTKQAANSLAHCKFQNWGTALRERCYEQRGLSRRFRVEQSVLQCPEEARRAWEI